MIANKRLLSAVMFGCGVAISSSALSEMYVSPVTAKGAAYTGTNQITTTSAGSQILGRQGYEANIGSRPSSSDSSLMRYGTDVPLMVAIENIAPVRNGWAINLDDNLTDMTVSWSGGETWQSVLRNIGHQNGLRVVISQQEKAVGVSTQEDIARHLASRVPQVWRISKKHTLKENIGKWAKQAGWSMSWDNDVKIDYPIEHNAVLTGLFEGDQGAVDQILATVKNAPKPLSAVFYKTNRVVRIVEAGYRIEE